jgi:hypothetical protein
MSTLFEQFRGSPYLNFLLNCMVMDVAHHRFFKPKQSMDILFNLNLNLNYNSLKMNICRQFKHFLLQIGSVIYTRILRIQVFPRNILPHSPSFASKTLN